MQENMLQPFIRPKKGLLVFYNQYLMIVSQRTSTISFTNVCYQNSSIESAIPPD